MATTLLWRSSSRQLKIASPLRISPRLKLSNRKTIRKARYLSARLALTTRARKAAMDGSSRSVANGFLRFNGNRDLALNMFNWLTSDEDLISIRPKEPADRRLNMNRSQVSMVFYSSVVLLPLLVVLAGVGV